MERDFAANPTVLSGDLSGNDVKVACATNSPDCNSNGLICEEDGFCIIPANNVENSFHVVTARDVEATATIDGFWVTAGYGNGPGLDAGGGGMFNYNGRATIRSCTFIANAATSTSAGMLNFFNSHVTVSNCVFKHNWAVSTGGGGMVNFSSRPLVLNSKFLRNSTGSGGGGMLNQHEGHPIVVNCEFIGNRAAFGGGMSNSHQNPSHPVLINNTFFGNVANQLGGGMYNSNGSNASINNCILWGNTDSGGMDESAQIHVSTGSPTVNYSLVQGGWTGIGGIGNLSSDPLFVDSHGLDGIFGSGDEDLRLEAGSLAIDAGNNNLVLEDTDLGGNPRVVDGDGDGTATVDMGAYEATPGLPHLTLEVPQNCASSQVVVELWMRQLTNPIHLYGAYLEYDIDRLLYRGDLSYYDNFINQKTPIQEADYFGQISLSSYAKDFSYATNEDTRLAVLVFDVLLSCGQVTVDFSEKYPSWLREYPSFVDIEPDLIDSPLIRLDARPPTFASCPRQVLARPEAGGCSPPVVTWDAPVAEDSCTSVSVTCYPPGGGTFPIGATGVTCTATDECGNAAECEFDVVVEPMNDLLADVLLDGVFVPTSRCVRVRSNNDCSESTDVEVVFIDHDDDDSNFNGIMDASEGGKHVAATPVHSEGILSVSCGEWSQVCVKDAHGSLTATASVTDEGAAYLALDPIVLRSGDTDNDDDIDIDDVTWFLSQFGSPSLLQECPWAGTRDADFSRNGFVGTEDYTFLAENWLSRGGCDCESLLPMSRSVKIASKRATLRHDRAADLNRDGVIDFRDVVALEDRYSLSGRLSRAMKASARHPEVLRVGD